MQQVRRQVGASTSIYFLHCGDRVPRYVGKTVKPLKKRLQQHRLTARGKCFHLPIGAWIASRKIEISLIEVVAADKWQERERFWISRFREQGHDLLNSTNGGEGLSGLKQTEDHKEARLSKIRKKIMVLCRYCGGEIWVKPSRLLCGRGRYCSRSCTSRANPHKNPKIGIAIAAAAISRKAKTHCPAGHPYSGDNLFINKRGARVCKICQREGMLKHRLKKRKFK